MAKAMDIIMKLQRINKEDFDKIYAQLVENFVPKERRDYADAKALLERSDYSVYHTVDGDEKIGFITIWSFDGFDFIEHFVTYPNYRNQGYGSKILALLKKSGKNLILEAELPENDIQKRRIAFYERCGFVKNPFDYVQPAYRKGENGVPMVLMSYPCELSQPTKTVSEIYIKVYNVSKNEVIMSNYIMDLRKIVGHRPLLQVGAGVIVEDKDGRILLQKRSDNHCWGYAGGSVELDEEVEAAARRELFEETGLIAGKMELFGVFSGKDLHYVYPNGDEVSNVEIVFLCKDYTGKLSCQAGEVDELAFFCVNDIPHKLSPPVALQIRQWIESKKRS